VLITPETLWLSFFRIRVKGIATATA